MTFFYFAYESLPACIHVYYIYVPLPWRPEEDVRTPEQLFVTHHAVLGTDPSCSSSARTASALSH